jgi:glycogen debranching enzyme
LPSREAQSTAMLVEPVPETPFYIAATGASPRPRRTLKHDDCFAVLDSHGDLGATIGGPDGIFRSDTRYLGRLELLINGMQPLLLGSNVRDDNSMLTVDLTNPDFYHEQRLVLTKDTLHIVRTLFLWRSTAYQRLRFQNHADRAAHLDVALEFSSDFADLFEVRGMTRPRRGSTSAAVHGANEVVLEYRGLDARPRRTLLRFEPAPQELTSRTARYALALMPGESYAIDVTVECCADGAERQGLSFGQGVRSAVREHRTSTQGRTTVSTSNVIFNEVLCRAMADLSMLTTESPQGAYPYAGIPWY